MHLKLIALGGKSDQLAQVVKPILNIHVLAALPGMTLIKIEHVAHISAAANFFDEQLRLYGPAANRRRIIADLQNLCLPALFAQAICGALGFARNEQWTVYGAVISFLYFR